MLDHEPEKYSFAGFFDDFKKVTEAVADSNYDDVIIAIADPSIRSQIVSSWSLNKVLFEPFLVPTIDLHRTVSINRGCVICPGVRMTVDIALGDFVIINLNATIGHGARIGRFTSIMPSVNISGNVSIGESVFIGTGATILQGISIGDHAIVGAGALVTKNVPAGSLVVGMPARERKGKQSAR